ncbi:MAG: outer membrane beta-barrel family protein [Mangrovibacterium sp.]
MKILSISSILLFCYASIHAQQTANVSGIVKTTANETLPYTNIRLVNSTDTTKVYGGSSNDEGAFSVPVPHGRYSMEISYIGYLKYISSVQVDKDVVLPDIILAEDSKLMNEIVITAKSITFKPNGYIADISINPFYKNYELDDILKLTPGTYANNREIKVYGKAVSKIFVNGREIRLQGEELIQYLKNFNGRNVKQMEVIASSGVEEDASSAGSSIIKITTVRAEDGGAFTAAISSNNGSSTHFGTANVNTQWRSGKWSTYLIGTFIKGKSNTSNRVESNFNNSGNTMITETSSKGKVPGNVLSTIGVGYDIDNNNLISVEGFFRSMRNDSHSILNTKQRNQSLADFGQTASGFSNNDNRLKNYNVSLNYTHLFNKESLLVFKLDRFQNDGKNSQNNEYVYVNEDHMQYKSQNEEQNLIYTAGINFEQSFNKGENKLVAGLKYSDISSESNTDYTLLNNGILDGNASYVDRYKYSEQVYALFSKYSFVYKAVSANLGFRLEHAVISPRSDINPERNEKSHYTDLFPEAGVYFNINKEKGHSIALQYNRAVFRPSMYSLNPLLKQESEYRYSSGNPLLKPSYSSLYSSRFTFFDRYLTNITYSVSKNRSIILGNVDADSDIIYTRPENGLKNKSLDIYMEYPLRIQSWGRLKLTGSYFFNESRFEDDKENNTSWDLGLSGMFRFPYDINIMTDISYGPPRKSLYTKSYSHVYSNININKSFLNRQLIVTLLFTDIFNMIGSQRTDSFFNDYSQKSKNTFDTFSVMARISYNLGWGNKSAKIHRTSSGNSTEQGRISSDSQ